MQKFVTGDLLLSVRYSPEHRKLQGIVLKATNLPRPHKWGLAGTCYMLCACMHACLVNLVLVVYEPEGGNCREVYCIVMDVIMCIILIAQYIAYVQRALSEVCTHE